MPTRPGRTGALLALLAFATSAQAQCPDLLVERFIPAECAACWSEAGAPPAHSVVLDWIVPSPRRDAAPLSAAAVAEAGARAGGIDGGPTRQRQHLLGRAGVRLTVEDGPAWHGYVGLRLRATRHGAAWPAGAAGYLALVETLRAGEDGTPVPRNVVRAVAGPLTLDDAAASTTHLVALRIPHGTRVDRLGALSWVEDGAGAVVTIAQAGAEDCPQRK